MTEDPEHLLVDATDGVTVVTLNRPHDRNALDAALRRTLYETMARLDADEGVRAVVLTGADPAFCAGLDLKELAAQPGALSGGSSTGDELGRPIPTMATPLLGAVNGVAITGGFELALACDFLVASEHARFADTHARVGIMPGWGLTVHLAEAVGIRRAKELSATGNFLDAPTALRWGLVNHVVSHEELLPFTRALAMDVAGNDPEGVAHVLGTYDAAAAYTRAEAFELETRRSREWIADRGEHDLDSARRRVTERGRRQM